MMDLRRSVKGLIQDSRKIRSMFRRLDRESVASNYLKGEGIEIGALHNPLKIPSSARVRYLDRMTVPDLRVHYPELNSHSLVEVDIVDDGETLRSIRDSTQDFVIANHFLEHCEDPIRALMAFVRVLRPGGILYLGLPDKRYTFDQHREVTPFEHLVRDFVEGPAWSCEGHFREWVTRVEKISGEGAMRERMRKLMDMNYSIHYHVWTQGEAWEMLTRLQGEFALPVEIEFFMKYEGEMLFILRRNPAG